MAMWRRHWPAVGSECPCRDEAGDTALLSKLLDGTPETIERENQACVGALEEDSPIRRSTNKPRSCWARSSCGNIPEISLNPIAVVAHDRAPGHGVLP